MIRIAMRVFVPVLLIVAVIAGFIAIDPLRSLTGSAPPIEELTVERTVLDLDGIALRLRAGGSEPVQIAQVQVDGAYWQFALDPPGPVARLQAAWLRVPYPWVLGEAHHLRLVTQTGATFDHVIEVAVATPEITSGLWRSLGLIGLFIGIVPVGLGMLFYPALRAGGAGSFRFALALTIGLLAFLLVDTLSEAMEFAAEAAPALQSGVVVWLVAFLTFAVLLAVGRRGGHAPEGLRLAAAIALGIGVHNFGEGLAVGAAFATGSAALGSFLVLGFTLHNLTEGVGIVAPLIRLKPTLRVFVLLAGVAGLPAVAGIWLGSYALAPHWAALAFAVGAGAIAQVIVEVGMLLVRSDQRAGRPWLSALSLAGIATGAAAMFATALLVQV